MGVRTLFLGADLMPLRRGCRLIQCNLVRLLVKLLCYRNDLGQEHLEPGYTLESSSLHFPPR